MSSVPLGTPGAQPFIFNPKIALLYDNKAGGGLSALKLDTGDEVWRTPHPGCNDVPGCSPAQSAAVTAIPGLVFSGGLDGHLRAYFADNGKIAWDMDTKGDYQTVNGVAAKGGSINGGGAVVVDGMLYVGSGSVFLAARPERAAGLLGRRSVMLRRVVGSKDRLPLRGQPISATWAFHFAVDPHRLMYRAIRPGAQRQIPFASTPGFMIPAGSRARFEPPRTLSRTSWGAGRVHPGIW